MKTLLSSLSIIASLATSVAAQDMRILTQNQEGRAQHAPEIAGMAALGDTGFTVARSEFQAVGIDLADGLRLLSTGAFDMATIQVGSVAKDDPFLEGIDLIGVSTNMTDLKAAVDAYRDVFNARLGEKFGVQAAAIWPFGPQVFLCNAEISSLADLDGLKVRSFTASMSTLLENLGVTSPTSSNTGKWPEVTTHLYPLSVSGSIQSHMVNLEWLNGLGETERAAFDTAMADMEAAMWELAINTNGTAQACSTAGDCPEGGLYTSYDMALVPVSDEDKAKVAEISVSAVLPEWAAKCEASYPGCKAIWNETVGAARGLSLE